MWQNNAWLNWICTPGSRDPLRFYHVEQWRWQSLIGTLWHCLVLFIDKLRHERTLSYSLKCEPHRTIWHAGGRFCKRKRKKHIFILFMNKLTLSKCVVSKTFFLTCHCSTKFDSFSQIHRIQTLNTSRYFCVWEICSEEKNTTAETSVCVTIIYSRMHAWIYLVSPS